MLFFKIHFNFTIPSMTRSSKRFLSFRISHRYKCKGKMHPCTETEALYRPYNPQGGGRGKVLRFHNYGTRRGEGSASRPDRSLPRERPGTHCIGGWVGPRAGLDRCGKSRSPPGFDPRTVQLVASRYTGYATRPTLTGILCVFFLSATRATCHIHCICLDFYHPSKILCGIQILKSSLTL
jgi:hypothetical protein